MSVTNPISSNQVISVPIDWKCLEVPCPTLTLGLQAIVDKICDEPDYTTLDFGCVTPSETHLGTLQSILTAIDEIGCGAHNLNTLTDATDLNVTGLTACSTDSWECNRADACFDFTNACDPGEITVGLVFQKLIDRNVAYGNMLKILCDRVTELEEIVADQQLAITNIQTSCCPA